MFSTTTTELSTTMPKSIAPRLNSVPAMPACSMPQKPKSIAMGIAMATINPAQVAEKHEQDDDHQQSAVEQITPHGVDNLIDQVGAVVDGFDTYAGGSCFFTSSSLSASRWVTA